MTSFAEKSQQSIQAAGLLLTSNLYPSSINRSYYSFFQFMMHVLFNKIKMDQHSFHAHIHCSGKKTHTLVWSIVGTAFVKNRPQVYSSYEWNKEYRWLQEKIKEFKKMRECADYHEDTIRQDDADQWIKNAQSMIHCLKKCFK